MPAVVVRQHSSTSTGSDWTVGYEEGKKAHRALSHVYARASAYLEAMADGLPRSHAWTDGFKSGWAVATDG